MAALGPLAGHSARLGAADVLHAVQAADVVGDLHLGVDDSGPVHRHSIDVLDAERNIRQI